MDRENDVFLDGNHVPSLTFEGIACDGGIEMLSSSFSVTEGTISMLNLIAAY